MKKTVFLILLGFILTFKLEAKKIEGEIIFNNKDTVLVIFNIPTKLLTQEINFEKLQYKVTYYDLSGRKMILSPDKATEIRFTYGTEDIRMISKHNSLGLGNIFSRNTHIFLRLEIDGKLKLFHYYYTERSAGMYNASTGLTTGGYSYSVERYVLQKGNEELKRPKSMNFKKDMTEYLSDCPKLVERIQSKDFSKNEVELIVEFYNSNCK